ncbi:MAG: POTRA domain-containing protein [Chloroherpetonaceae bacterium]|nr:POTRA domain-containing protein [Chloroherpetonaceae bacterium]
MPIGLTRFSHLKIIISNKRIARLGLVIFWLCLSFILPNIVEADEPSLRRGFSPLESARCIGKPITKIQIIGNSLTQDFVIEQELFLQPGDTLTLRAMQLSQQRVYNLQLFNLVQVSAREFLPQDSTPVSLTDEDTLLTSVRRRLQAEADATGEPIIAVLISVYERWYIFPQPRAELRGISMTQWIRNPTIANINWGLTVTHQNLTGYSDALSLGFGVGFDPYIRLGYYTPYFFGRTRTGFGISTIYRELNNLALDPVTEEVARYTQYTLGVSASITQRLSTFESIGATFSLNSYVQPPEILSTQPAAAIDKNGRDRYPSVFLAYSYSQTDLNQCPREGIFAYFGLEQQGFPSESTESFNLTRAYLDFRIYEKIWGELSLGFRNFTSLSTNKPVPNFERQFFGYRLAVRGYTQRIFAGDNIQFNSVEMRYPLISLRTTTLDFMPLEQFQLFQYALFITTFFDAGNIWYNPATRFNGSRQTKFDWQAYKYGYGFGIVLVGGYRVTVRLDFAFNDLGRLDIIFENSVSF